MNDLHGPRCSFDFWICASNSHWLWDMLRWSELMWLWADSMRLTIMHVMSLEMDRRKEKSYCSSLVLFLCVQTHSHLPSSTSVLCNTVVLSSHSYMWRFRHFSPEILNKRQVMLDRCWVHSPSESGSTAVLPRRVPTDVYTLSCIKWSIRCTHRKSLWVWFVPVELIDS